MSGASELGNAINEKRLSLHYSIGQLATVVGVTASEVRSWENGEKLPDETEIAKLSEALKLKKGELNRLLPAEAPPDATEAVPDATAVVAASPKTKRPAKAKEEVGAAEEPAVEAAADEAPAAESPVRSKVTPPQPVVSKQKAPAEPEPEPDIADEPEAVADDVADEGPSNDGAPDAPADDLDAPAEAAPVAITDLPTERIPIIKDAPPPPERQPAPSPVAVATPPPPRPMSIATATETPLTPWRQTMEMIFDRDKPWLFWIRTGLLLISMLILLRVLAWAVPEFFGTLGEILDTIQSTNPDPELNDPIPISP